MLDTIDYPTPDLQEIQDNNILELSSNQLFPQCLKIAQKVAFNIASEASYVYFLIDAKNGAFMGQTVLISGKCQNWKTQMRHFE